ncbi:rhodanese-like domain-containing protein [Engelhardtia mirabilis]
MQTTDVTTLKQRLDQGLPVRLVDVRSPAEFRAVHARGAVSIPIDRIDHQSLEALPGEGPIYVICRSGTRSEQACRSLAGSPVAGEVVSVDGGTQAWERAGLPIERGEGGAIDIERQVRIIAGLLVVLGTLLGFTVSPAWHALSGVVGAGVAYAGITGSCAMGMVLARMPWNR